MSQVLLINGQKELAGVLSLNLHVYTGADIVLKKDPAEALDFLKVVKLIDLVIIDDDPEGPYEDFTSIRAFLEESRAKIPLIYRGPRESFPGAQFVFGVESDLQKLIASSAKLMGVTALAMAEQSLPDFFPVPLAHFELVQTCVCDVFLAMGGPSKGKYVKRFRSGDECPEKVLKRYGGFGVKYLYIASHERLSFAKKFSENILCKLKNKKLEGDEKLQVAHQAMDFVMDDIREFGLTGENVAISKACIESINAICTSVPDLGDLFQDLLNNKSGYRYKHAQIIIYICHQIKDDLEWSTKELVDKLAFVAFFHDISLSDDKLARVNDLKSFLREAKVLSDKEKQMVQMHAYKSAEMIRSFPQSPIDVDVIIRQHHGVLNGVGFPKFFSSALSPIAIVFIVVETFADLIITAHEGKMPKEEILPMLRETFKKQKFKQVVELIEKIKF